MPGLEGLASRSTQLCFASDCFTFLCLADAHCVKFAVSDTGVYKNKEERKKKRLSINPCSFLFLLPLAA